MKAIVVEKPGGPEQLVLKDVENPTLIPEHSIIKIKGFGINHSEIFTRKGYSPTVQFPRILGIECVGLIEETEENSPFSIGETVVSFMGEMGRAFDGSYAEYTLLPNEQIYPIQTKLSWQELAAIPETYYTAYGSLKNLKIEKEDHILVRAASSGVGVAFAKLVKALFPSVYLVGSIRHMSKENKLLKIGFDEIILDQDGILQTHNKFNKVLELVGPATLLDTFQHVEEYGIVCSTGQLGGKWTLDFDPIEQLPRNSYLTSFYSGHIDIQLFQEMIQVIETKDIHVSPEKIYDLEHVIDAHRYLEDQHSLGKVVVINE